MATSVTVFKGAMWIRLV